MYLFVVVKRSCHLEICIPFHYSLQTELTRENIRTFICYSRRLRELRNVHLFRDVCKLAEIHSNVYLLQINDHVIWKFTGAKGVINGTDRTLTVAN